MKTKSPLRLLGLLAFVSASAPFAPFAFAQVPGAVNAGATSAPTSGNSAASTAAALPSASATTSTVTSTPAGSTSAATNSNTAAATGNRTAAINASANNPTGNNPGVSGAVTVDPAMVNAVGASTTPNVGAPNNPAILNAGTPATTQGANAASGSANANFNDVANQTVDRSPLTIANTPGLSRTAVGPSPSANGPTSTSVGTRTTTGTNPPMTSSGGNNFAASNASTLAEINRSTRATRESALNQVDTNLNLSITAVSDLRSSGSQLSGEARSRFDSAFENLQAKQSALTRSLTDARRASDTDYGTARDQLAADYSAYLQASSQAQAAARKPTSSSGK